MARPLSQATTKQTLVARMRAGPQADHRASTQFLGPTPVSSTMHQSQRHENRSFIVNAGISRPSATPHRCTEDPTGNHGRYTWPTSVTQRGFPHFLLTHAKRGFLYSRQKSHPALLNGLSLNIVF